MLDAESMCISVRFAVLVVFPPCGAHIMSNFVPAIKICSFSGDWNSKSKACTEPVPIAERRKRGRKTKVGSRGRSCGSFIVLTWCRAFAYLALLSSMRVIVALIDE